MRDGMTANGVEGEYFSVRIRKIVLPLLNIYKKNKQRIILLCIIYLVLFDSHPARLQVFV